MDANSAREHSIKTTGNNNNSEDDDQNSNKTNNNNNQAGDDLRRNPSILLALDSVHRSLLLKNLQFDHQETSTDGDSVSGSGGTCDEDLYQHQHHYQRQSEEEEEEDPLEALMKSSEVVEVTRTHAQVDCPKHITEQQTLIVQQQQHFQYKHTADEVDGSLLELVKLKRDRNNNIDTRVMMMVAKYESGKGLPVDETETSDFDTASVSSSSLGSVRSSSAFSEISRDVVSMENYACRMEPEVVAVGESHVVTAGAATITINIINKGEDNCDKRPLRASPEMKAVHVQVPELTSEDEPRVESPSEEEESTECEQELDITELCSEQSLYDSRNFQTPESQEFLDCKDYLDSSNSVYDGSSEGTHDQPDGKLKAKPRQCPKVAPRQEVIDDADEPMINIIQEMTHDMQVTSTVILNKAKIKEHRKTRSTEKKQKAKSEKKKLENSHLSRQKIIDDNFCNEILDSTIHFDRLYGINRKTAVETPSEVLSDSALQPSSAGDESFDSSMSFGKLEGKPRYSGRPVGRLMARRLKKIEKQKPCKSDGHSDSSTSNYANGPKKPPRTFASSMLESTASEESSGKSSTRGKKPSCPKLEDLGSDPSLIGWKFDKKEKFRTTEKFVLKDQKSRKKEKTHEIGWTVPTEQKNASSIPSHIYSMLHYSDDEARKRLIKTSHSRAAPQSSCCHRAEEKLGTKLDIDTVDIGGHPETPRRKTSSNLDFERFVANSKIKSTPNKRYQQDGKRTELFLDSERGERKRRSPDRRTQLFLDSERSERRPRSPDRRRRTTGDLLEREREAESRNFLDDGRRSDHEPDADEISRCKKCNDKSEKKSFRKAAVRRTKSFFEASKKKIHLQGLKKNSKEKDRFETPKKYEMGSNLNEENSVKKQLHKHLGYTPDHLRCGSCPKESGMVRNNLAQVKSAPARMANDNDDSRPRLPARTVLNFSGPDMASEEDAEKDRKKRKPHEMKFLKTLKNLKISPKKLFKPSGEPKACPMASSPRHYGDFQSYDDLNLDNVAQMGDFLNNVRRAVETERHNSKELDKICFAKYTKTASSSTPRDRLISTSSEFLDRPDHRQVQVSADLHREPIYQEISPKNNKTIINEFISGESSKRYLMVNNNPNVLYATVNKTPKNLIKTKSVNSFCDEYQQQPISVKKLNAEPSTPSRLNTSTETQSHGTSSRLRRSLFSNAGDSGGSGGGNGGDCDRPNMSGSVDEDNDISVLQDDEVREEVILRRHIGSVGSARNTGNNSSLAGFGDEDEYREFSSDIYRTNSGTMARGALTCEEQLLRSTMAEAAIGRAPLGYIDTDEEVESLQKYEDKGLDDLFVSLRENITLSEIGTIDTESEAFITGYDTVDAIPVTPSRRNDLEAASDNRNTSVDTDNISELMSAHDYSVSNLSPVNSSPSSGKMRLNGSDIYRNLKDKFRSSFRRSKNFIKNEQRKIVNYFDEKPGKREAGNRVAFDLDEYRKKYDDDTETEEIYQSLNNTESLVEMSNHFLAELVNQIKTQCDIKKQLKQALSVCRNTREFECSSELIEAERLLLLSTLKETAARNELSKIDYNSNGKVLNDGKKVGVVALNHFEFPLKEAAISDMLFNYFYVVVCSYKNQVKATVAKERNEDRVYFRNSEIKFYDLDADYEIRVEMFVLRLRKNARNYSFESKYHLNKDNKNLLASCPSPPKLLSPAKLLSSRSGSPKNFDFDNEFSRFKSQGFITLTSFSLLPANSGHQMNGNDRLLENCLKSPYYSASSNFQQMVRQQGDHNIYLVEDFKYLKLDSMVYNANLLGSIGMSIKSEVLFANSEISGFLTVAESRNGGIDWSRKWCKVNGFVLEFWNYPQECQEKLPTLQIDLTKCINDEVELADRSTCSRPRTFRLDVFAKGTSSCSSSGVSSFKDTDSHQQQNRNSGMSQHQQQPQQSCDNTKNYLLSVDTPNELKMWLNELNRVVKFLKEWKI